MIERDVPVPPISKELYPWAEMQVGDSLWFAKRRACDINVLRWKAQKRHGIKLAQRKLTGGVRVWRVE